MTITAPTLTATIAHDADKTLIGTLAPTGGVGPYKVLMLWPAGPGRRVAPNRLGLFSWPERALHEDATWTPREGRPAATWRPREARSEVFWT